MCREASDAYGHARQYRIEWEHSLGRCSVCGPTSLVADWSAASRHAISISQINDVDVMRATY